MAGVMAAIFAADTVTNYEVAAAVFYTVVILASRGLAKRELIALAVICIVLTAVSLAFTPKGNLQSGMLNMGISITAIIMITYLILKMEAARTAAHDAQAQLMRIARVKSLEGLTTSIAHEVNQPLTAIVTSGNACQRWMAQEPPNLGKARQALDRILNDAGRASSIIARVRSLTRGEPPCKQSFPFNSAVIEVIDLSRAEIERYDITLATSLEDDLPQAFADRVQIQQVIGNLLLNAIEAMTEISTQSRNLRITSAAREGNIIFSISDSGAGIPSEVYEHLFETFWTTKKDGIGVGLSISRAIIEANNGQIWAEQNEGSGAIFQFSVPISLKEEPQ